MSDLTIEKVQQEHTRLGKMIEQLKLAAQAVTLAFPAVEISLLPGERYAGPVLDKDGKVKHHLILLAARPTVDVNWKAAKAWAEEVGGTLPDRQEQALLFANCKDALPQRWCWSSEPEGSSSAWNCYFGNGGQDYYNTSYDGSAVAVRRLNP